MKRACQYLVRRCWLIISGGVWNQTREKSNASTCDLSESTNGKDSDLLIFFSQCSPQLAINAFRNSSGFFSRSWSDVPTPQGATNRYRRGTEKSPLCVKTQRAFPIRRRFPTVSKHDYNACIDRCPRTGGLRIAQIANDIPALVSGTRQLHDLMVAGSKPSLHSTMKSSHSAGE